MADYSISSHYADVNKSGSGVSIKLQGPGLPKDFIVIPDDAARSLYFALKHYFQDTYTTKEEGPKDPELVVIKGLMRIITELINV